MSILDADDGQIATFPCLAVKLAAVAMEKDTFLLREFTNEMGTRVLPLSDVWADDVA